MEPLKAPGVDGIHATFYQKNWEVVGQSVCDFVKNVWNGVSFEDWINRTLLVLILKAQNPEQLSQFRPISLCTVLYKIVSKVIVHKLRPLIIKWVYSNQSSFVPGRSIMDNIIVA